MTNFKTLTDTELEIYISNPDALYSDAAKQEREASVANPDIILAFDQRTEVSADAKYIAGRIVKHLWIIFIVMPLIIGILWAILSQMK